MSDRSSRAQLSVPASRLIKRSASASPIPSGKPQTTSTFKRSPVVTRSSPKPAASVNMSLSDFIAAADRLIKFEARIDGPGDSNATHAAQLRAFEIRRDRVKALWDDAEQQYKVCARALSQGASSGEVEAMEAKFDNCYSVYERCTTHLGVQIDALSVSSTPPAPMSAPFASSGGCRLPPVDTEVFHGDYLRWPTFRDLFTAIYIQNPRLTPVEKLFHLNSKTADDANALVAECPLTNDGFASAWDALCDRYENKRLLVNSQLKILLNLPKVTKESGAALRELHGNIHRCVTAIAQAQISTENWDCILVFLCTSKLPEHTRSLWEHSLTRKSDIPAWKDVSLFISEHARALEAMEGDRSLPKVPGSDPKSTVSNSHKKVHAFESQVHSKSKKCDLCAKENHPVRLCPRFIQMSLAARETYIKRRQLCLNCFAQGHQLRDCTSIHNCAKCKGRHNTLLHREGSTATSSSSGAAVTPGTSEVPCNVQSYFTADTPGVLLGTAVIDVCHLGVTYPARALIDSGSEATFISERLFRLMKLPFRSVQTQVSGLGHSVAAKSTKLCDFHIGTPLKPRLRIEASALVIPRLSGNLPSYPIPQQLLNNLPDIPLADPLFFKSAQIDVLLGADILPADH
ncbi:uncharacterized protein LOC122757417 [Drosophila mojavensis]|uniref:uncharacterized protein LOC122757417 n=1 Tax=Drosophila mojavensis TaxID=7230 RepID=UPI001CD0C8BB|nr:uncharacterized protein LOC122757417 [Drosophila mojavensis]